MSNSEDTKAENEGKDKQKKVFNKKKWREERYSVKVKVKRYEESRKRKLMKKYYKELKRSGFDVGKIREEDRISKLSAFKKAQFEYNRIQEEKRKKKEELERLKKERSEALKAYREKKKEKFRKLSQRTSKGQPVMKGRIELLLEKIEKNYANNNS